MSFGFRQASDGDRVAVLRWRNHPDVRRVMFTDHEISEVEHQQWWERARSDARYRLLICQWEGRDVGVVNFSNIDDSSCDWGFYFDPDAFGRGATQLRAWRDLEEASLEYAAEILGCHELRCEVFAFNRAVLAMHLRHGFVEVGRYVRQRDSELQEVIRLARRLEPSA
jgi:UDP-4-amino-4,6-dideoxy-N-acetyl-beta-L-altrosamine N-acetyltransferase